MPHKPCYDLPRNSCLFAYPNYLSGCQGCTHGEIRLVGGTSAREG